MSKLHDGFRCERSNMDLKSKKCIFLGLGKRVKGYKLWDHEVEKGFWSRKVFEGQYKVQHARQYQVHVITEIDTNTEITQKESGGDILDTIGNEHAEQGYKEERGTEDSMTAKKPKCAIRLPIRFGCEDMVNYALMAKTSDSSIYQEEELIGFMTLESVSPKKNQTWDLGITEWKESNML